jgi:hypothetical protein
VPVIRRICSAVVAKHAGFHQKADKACFLTEINPLIDGSTRGRSL